jgi:hypothetical protein
MDFGALVPYSGWTESQKSNTQFGSWFWLQVISSYHSFVLTCLLSCLCCFVALQATRTIWGFNDYRDTQPHEAKLNTEWVCFFCNLFSQEATPDQIKIRMSKDTISWFFLISFGSSWSTCSVPGPVLSPKGYKIIRGWRDTFCSRRLSQQMSAALAQAQCQCCL